jgi:mono/diheme cytochrome c family protein
MKRNLFFIATFCTAMSFSIGCGNQNQNGNTSDNSGTSSDTSASSSSNEGSGESTNPKGVGQYTDVQLTHPLDQNMIAAGEKTYDVKCASCHKLTDEKLVGPGWKGVTDRRTPEWIMNFVTNTEEMLQKDTAAKNLLEVCLVQMPNQNLAEADARSVLELMRKNDGKK